MLNKIIMGSLVASVLLINANANEFEHDGFGGSISLGGGARSLKSNINPANDARKIGSYNDTHKSNDGTIFVGLDLYYKGIRGEDKIFLKNYNGRDISGLSAGYAFNYGANTTEIALVSAFGEEAYANPYQLNVDREVVDRYQIGGRIGHTFRFGENSKVYGNYTFAKDDYDKEVLAESLKRDGYLNEFEIGYGYKGYSIGAFYDFKDAKGGAESYDSYGIKLKASSKIFDDKTYAKAGFEYGKRNYDDKNIIFDKKRETDVIKLDLTLTREDIFGFNNFYVFASYLYGNYGDDIGFFDERYHIGLAGVGYRF
ncbi:DUF2860 family protein [Helicobacter burdigaliensis]|uniref:DUF2860 family protein n=1 Tax=Helicobacter burdigaliensis TaxID=2315334 RepID=UPI000EF6673B|nr:DUF2860 family protein [Helicobacter burdigaliensis]